VKATAAAVVFDKSEPPTEVTITYWTRIHRDRVGSVWFDRPKGTAHTIEAQIEPVIASNGLTWRAAFELDQSGPAYLAVKAVWKSDLQCPTCNQRGQWAFALRRPYRTRTGPSLRF
jgi:hypothetical protein